MKKIIVNRQTFSASFQSCKNLGQLIAHIEKQGEADGHFVVRVNLNSKPLGPEEEQLLDGLSINDVKELEVYQSTLQEIMGQAIKDIILSIQDLQLRSIRFCKDFRAQDKVDDEKVKFILIQCRGVIESLEEVFKSHTAQKFTIKHHSLWIEAEKEFTNILQCIFQARGLAKVEFIADLLEYDLVQALDQWEEVLESELIDNSVFSGIFSLKNNGVPSDNGLDV